MSKIQSESNSQQSVGIPPQSECCDQYVKDTIWKQFTTRRMRWLPERELWPICQRYNLKAIHNIARCMSTDSRLWPICQRYNLKAIHNCDVFAPPISSVVTNMSKIQSESNSQPLSVAQGLSYCCDQYVKDTIWKQFTTEGEIGFISLLLWPICQRYNLKAIHNIHLFVIVGFMLWPICQRYNLKAIHNSV